MGFFSALRKVLTGWYVVVPLLVALGIAVGALTFVYAFPGKPQIGVIDIPFTVLTEDSAYVIGKHIDYARRDDSIKAVVIKLTTPGGGAAASEHLYIELRKLREEKPVVLVMNGLVASGGYMMAMGVNYSYAKTSSLVGNVGVISSAGPLISPLPDEEVVFSGPHKLDGSSRRDWIGTVDQLKSAFAQIVISERGDRLRISRAELVEARLYSGVDAVRLGLVDEIGSDSDAIQKAADLAGISNYGLVDVNLKCRWNSSGSYSGSSNLWTAEAAPPRPMPSTCLRRTTTGATLPWKHTERRTAAACQDSRPCKDSCATGGWAQIRQTLCRSSPWA